MHRTTPDTAHKALTAKQALPSSACRKVAMPVASVVNRLGCFAQRPCGGLSDTLIDCEEASSGDPYLEVDDSYDEDWRQVGPSEQCYGK